MTILAVRGIDASVKVRRVRVLTNICMVSSLSVKLCLAGSWRAHRARDGAQCLHPCEIFDQIPQGCAATRISEERRTLVDTVRVRYQSKFTWVVLKRAL